MVKQVLLEYSPRDEAVFVRGIWADGKAPSLAPIHEDNSQRLVRVTEGVDNLENSSMVLWLSQGRRGEPPERRTGLSSPNEKRSL